MGSITAKKNNQKIGSINYKLAQTKKVKDRVDEFLSQPLDIISPNQNFSSFRLYLENFEKNPDDEKNRNNLESEITRLLDECEKNK